MTTYTILHVYSLPSVYQDADDDGAADVKLLYWDFAVIVTLNFALI